MDMQKKEHESSLDSCIPNIPDIPKKEGLTLQCYLHRAEDLDQATVALAACLEF